MGMEDELETYKVEEAILMHKTDIFPVRLM